LNEYKIDEFSFFELYRDNISSWTGKKVWKKAKIDPNTSGVNPKKRNLVLKRQI